MPATATLLAGQTTANFNLSIVNNTMIDGAQPVNVTAGVENWTSRVASIDINDNDSTVTVTIPASGWEGQNLERDRPLGEHPVRTLS